MSTTTPAPTPFVDVFWGKGDEVTGPYEGFETLYQRIKDGQSMTQALCDVVMKRAQMEKAYGEAMMKLGDTKQKDNIGDMKDAWDHLMLAFKDLGQKHLEVSRSLQSELGHRLKEFQNDQSNVRKQAKKAYTEKMDKKEKAYQQVNKCKKASAKAFHDYDVAQDAARDAASAHTKDMDKARLKAEKARVTSEDMDMQHRHSVVNLEVAKDAWENEYESTCQTMQELEADRIEHLRTDIWTLTNLGSFAATSEDQIYESVRVSLERIDVNKELEATVSAKRTGNVRPASVPYVSCNPKARETVQSVPTRPLSQLNAVDDTVYRDSFAVPDDANVTPAPVAPVPEPTPEKKIGTPYKALFNYKAQGPAELTFEQGDIITITATEEDPWYSGEFNGQSGMVYKEFLEQV